VRVCVWKQVFACFLISISRYCEIVRVCVWKPVFASFLILIWENLFCSAKIVLRKIFLFQKTRKNFGGKKIHWTKKYFCWAKKVGPFNLIILWNCESVYVKTGFCVFSYFNLIILWNCESVCVKTGFCVFSYFYFTVLWNCESVCVKTGFCVFSYLYFTILWNCGSVCVKTGFACFLILI
jgi:hypothetical protein